MVAKAGIAGITSNTSVPPAAFIGENMSALSTDPPGVTGTGDFYHLHVVVPDINKGPLAGALQQAITATAAFTQMPFATIGERALARANPNIGTLLQTWSTLVTQLAANTQPPLGIVYHTRENDAVA